MNKIKVKFVMIFVFIISFINVFGYINLAPTTLDKNIGKGAYEEYNLWNDTNIPFRYKITPIEMNKNSKVKDMSKWVEVYPKIVTVKPQSSEKFKVYVKAPKNSETGDYGAFLNIRQMSAPKVKGEEEKQNLGAGAIIMVNLNLGIYGYVGDEKPKLTCIEKPKISIKDGKSYLKMKLKNDTNRLVRMKVVVEGGRERNYMLGEVRAFKDEIVEFDNEILNLKDKKVKKVVITDVETKEIIDSIKIN